MVKEPNLESLFLAGPTAVGKSEVALWLAERLPGEIISVDSMQVYCGLDIGTAKPALAERQRVPHHLIDVRNLDQLFDAAQFVRLARAAVQEIQARGRVPIFCGGTGLYFKAFLEGLDAAPPADVQLRAELEAAPLPVLLAELERRDPMAFQHIARQNPRRVIRALEIIRLTGQPFSERRADGQPASRQGSRNVRFFGLARAAENLRARINVRVDWMFQRGLVEETKGLLERGLDRNKTAMQAIGYRQVVEHLQGKRSLADTITLVKTRTWQFARRQMTWFRHQANLQWLPVGPDESAAVLAERVLSRLLNEPAESASKQP